MDKHRLAVLNIKNLADENYKYVVDGLSELAIDIFIRTNKYVILSSESTQKFNIHQIDEVYDSLNVHYIFMGEFSIEESKTRLDIQIFEKNVKTSIWKETIEIETIKIIQIGSKLQSSIEQFVDPNTSAINTIPRLPQNIEIRTWYELGNHYLNKHDPSYAELALQQYQKVIDKEPDFLPAYVGYAETAIFLVGRGYHKADILYPKVLDLLDTMIRFNPNYGELYICRGIIDFFYTLDWESTYNNIEKGLASFSEASKSYLQLSFFWYGMKNYNKALECIDIALEYNPLSISLLNMKSDIYLSSRDYKKARENYLSILKINPDDKVAFEYLMFIALLENNQNQAKYYKNKLTKEAGEDVVNHPRLLFYYGAMGLEEEWNSAKKQINALEIEVMKLGRMALLYAGIGDKDKLMYFIEKAFNARTGILFILTDPIFDIVRSWSRYQLLEAQIKLPQNLSTGSTIIIQSDLKESIELNPKNLLYAQAQGKYVMIYHFRHFRVQNIMLRMRLETLLQQLPNELFWRSHRSFIMNRSLLYETSGNSRGYTMTNRKYDFEIPVSRSKVEEMQEIINK